MFQQVVRLTESNYLQGIGKKNPVKNPQTKRVNNDLNVQSRKRKTPTAVNFTTDKTEEPLAFLTLHLEIVQDTS